MMNNLRFVMVEKIFITWRKSSFAMVFEVDWQRLEPMGGGRARGLFHLATSTSLCKNQKIHEKIHEFVYHFLFQGSVDGPDARRVAPCESSWLVQKLDEDCWGSLRLAASVTGLVISARCGSCQPVNDWKKPIDSPPSATCLIVCKVDGRRCKGHAWNWQRATINLVVCIWQSLAATGQWHV
jgi:hypothetical protein